MIDTCASVIVGSTVEVFTNEENEFTGLFFQGGLKKSVFAAFPEVVLVDATYKLLDLRMPVYLWLSIDGNGQSEIVRVFLAALETQEVISYRHRSVTILHGHIQRS